MWNYTYTDELYHYGVKGMKWGVRRYQNKDGSLTPAGIKKYARKQYAKESYASNKTVLGKVYDKYTGAHKISADILYGLKSKSENRAAAEKYLAEESSRKKDRRRSAASSIAKGVATVNKISAEVGKAYITDMIFYGGAGTRFANALLRKIGMEAITFAAKARGDTDIKWYYKGQRVR